MRLAGRAVYPGISENELLSQDVLGGCEIRSGELSFIHGRYPAKLSSMESQFREIVRQRSVDALAAPPPALTRRDVWLPAVPGKAVAVIGKLGGQE